MRRHPRPRERGIALLLVVWVFMILGVIALDFARYMRDDAMSALNAAEETRGYYLALAGMNRAIFDIERAREGGGKDTQAGNVTPDDPEVADEGDLTSLVNGDWREKTFAGGRYAVRVTDECGRVPVNKASGNLIKLVVTNIMRGGNATRGVDRRTQGSIDVVVDSILDWRDADDSAHAHGAESDYYLGLRPPYRAKDGWLDSVEELLQVRGVTPALFYGSDSSPGLRDVFSVLCSEVRVNLHTAPPPVIQALLAADPAELADLVAQRDEDFDGFYAVVLQRTGSVCPPADITGTEGGAAGGSVCFKNDPTPSMVAIEGRADLALSRNRSHVMAVVSFSDAADGAKVLRWVDRAPWEGGLPGDEQDPAAGSDG
jgi:type II secretory pathway component PulK